MTNRKPPTDANGTPLAAGDKVRKVDLTIIRNVEAIGTAAPFAGYGRQFERVAK